MVDSEVDLPQIGPKDPPDHHEAVWLYGHDSRTGVGYYLYVVADRDNATLRHESAYVFLPDGSVLSAHGAGFGTRDRIAAGEHVELECLAPFHLWQGRFRGPMTRVAAGELVHGPSAGAATADVTLDLQATSVAEPWDTEGDWGEQPPSFRYHQLHRATGTLIVDGRRFSFGGTGFRSHSRRRRDQVGSAGHAITNAVFPDGRGFGLLRYRATADRPERGRGFVLLDGAVHNADVLEWPHLTEAHPGGERFRVVLAHPGGTATIEGESLVSPFMTIAAGGRRLGVHEGGFLLSAGIARFSWDGRTATGPLERSAGPSAVTMPTTRRTVGGQIPC
jgi:hypothetical protein